MAKMTLLEMTQNILSAMNSDEVNSITDTVESQQVAEEIKTTFEELYSNRDLAEMEGLITLEATGDPLRPNTLRLPLNINRVKWIKYLDFRSTNSPDYKFVEYMRPEDFINRIAEMPTSSQGVVNTVRLSDTADVSYTINAEKAPSYYTILDRDRTLSFDSYDSAYESNLQGGRALAWGIHDPIFEMNDQFIAPIDTHLFPHFLAEAKSACFINIKEVANSKEEARARRQLVRSQFRTHMTNGQRRGVFDSVDYSKRRR